ncbi:MAG: oxidoreductase [Bacteroidales bacterium]|nr:oxidoreductase [Bacteroidales bacterium]
MQIVSPVSRTDYRLEDCGDGEKLERFGPYLTIRPEPNATWARSEPLEKWIQRAHLYYQAGKGQGVPGREDSGTWKKLKNVPRVWNIQYKDLFTLQVGPTAYKHVGVFPEQACNWDFIYDKTEQVKKQLTKTGGNASDAVPWVLNLFAYTGAASLAAKAAGAEVVHLDAVRQVITWSRKNMELSGMTGIRWAVEDALTFVEREVRRGNKYHGIVLDPPTYGYGPKGERWKLEEGIHALLEGCSRILEKESAFLVLNLYTPGYTATKAGHLIKEFFPGKGKLTMGQPSLEDAYGKRLSLGAFARLEL